MAYLNSYRAIGNRVDRWQRGRWVNGFDYFSTEEEAEKKASELNRMVREKRKALGLTRPRSGAYGKTYPDSRTRPEEPKAERVRQTRSAQKALAAAMKAAAEKEDGQEE